jgi:hypothetical protein
MFEPLSREFLLSRGYCCHNDCENCPYSEQIIINESDLTQISNEFNQLSNYVRKASSQVDSNFEYKRMCVQISNITSVRVYMNLRQLINNIKGNLN